ncbi:MAG: flippase-like domain-containing protein [Planctomycetota bacterium]|nr:MAG: flippase-like domain-containing protein [Planctomycetota bacterium]
MTECETNPEKEIRTVEPPTKEAKKPANGGKRGRFRRRFLFGIGLGVVVIAVIFIYADVSELARELGNFQYLWFIPVLALALANYLLRFLKWEYFLGRLDIEVPKRTSFCIFMSGLLMSITPGKIGELLKSYLLRVSNGTPMATSAPIVIAERITDLIAVILLCMLGLWVLAAQIWIVVVAGAVVASGLLAVAFRPVGHRLFRLCGKLPGMGRFRAKLDELYESMHSLLRPVPLVLMTLLSLVAWGCECLGLYLVLIGFGVENIGVVGAFFIYAFSTLIGIIMPGGLGLTDFSLVGLTQRLGSTSKAVASGGAVLIRLATLWFAVGIGAVVFFWFNRSLHVDLDDVDSAGGEGDLCREETAAS